MRLHHWFERGPNLVEPARRHPSLVFLNAVATSKRARRPRNALLSRQGSFRGEAQGPESPTLSSGETRSRDEPSRTTTQQSPRGAVTPHISHFRGSTGLPWPRVHARVCVLLGESSLELRLQTHSPKGFRGLQEHPPSPNCESTQTLLPGSGIRGACNSLSFHRVGRSACWDYKFPRACTTTLPHDMEIHTALEGPAPVGPKNLPPCPRWSPNHGDREIHYAEPGEKAEGNLTNIFPGGPWGAGFQGRAGARPPRKCAFTQSGRAGLLPGPHFRDMREHAPPR